MFVRLLILSFTTMLVLTGCSALAPVNVFEGSGDPVTQSFAFAGFDSLEIGNAFQAEITAADTYLVEVTVDGNLVEHLQVEQQGETVTIGLKPMTTAHNAEMRVRITLPALVSLEASGATSVNLTGFSADKQTDLRVSGASKVRGDMETGDLTVDVSGGSTVALSGKGKNLRVTASGASTADLRDFSVNDANVEASGASRIEVNAAGTLNAKASGASTVHYTGNPTLGRIDESGASSVSSQ
jgi:hypothetical protein